MSEIVNRGNFSFAVKYPNIIELAETVNKMLTDANLSRRMGQKGHKYVFENCDWANIVAKPEKFTKSLEKVLRLKKWLRN